LSCLLTISSITVLEVALGLNDTALRPVHAGFGEPQQPIEGPLTEWVHRVPAFESDSALLKSVFDQSVVDRRRSGSPASSKANRTSCRPLACPGS
jgi:hypothetical protein